MVKRTHLVRLRDILETIDAVGEMMTGVDLAGYRRDYKLRRAVERCVEIVSEASRGIPSELKSEFTEQPWPEIAAIGNLLRHSYDRVDDLITWKIARLVAGVAADYRCSDQESPAMRIEIETFFGRSQAAILNPTICAFIAR